MPEETTYEYGIMHCRYDSELWRGPWEDEATADDWINSWLEDGGRRDMFYKVRRPIGGWVKY